MRVLITGAAGQVGRALCATRPQGAVLRGLTRGELNVTDAAAIEAAVKDFAPDWIVNAAAWTAVDGAEAEPEAAFAANADAPTLLARAAAAHHARLLHLSTDFVFDGRASRPYRLDATPNPLSTYGASKLAGERAVAEVLRERALILRTAWIYDGNGRNFATTMLRLMRGHGAVSVVADQVGTPTSASDLARAIWRAIGRKLSGIHHWTSAGVASWYDFAVAIEEEARAAGLLERRAHIVPIRTEDFPTPAARPAYSVLDQTETWAALGMTAPHWRDGLRRMLAAQAGE